MAGSGKKVLIGPDLLKRIRQLETIVHAMIGQNGIKVTRSETNILISWEPGTDQGEGSSTPSLSGYSEVSLEFCHPTLGPCTGTFLVKDVVETSS